MDLKAFEKSVYQGIPIAKEIGVRVRFMSLERAILFAPLEANRNFKMTAFGGSIYSVAVLSCWALVTQALEQSGLETEHAVVQNANIDYVLPITADFTAEAQWKDAKEHDRFIAVLKKRGLARASLSSEIKVGDKIYARFAGRFAARLSGDRA